MPLEKSFDANIDNFVIISKNSIQLYVIWDPVFASKFLHFMFIHVFTPALAWNMTTLQPNEAQNILWFSS